MGIEVLATAGITASSMWVADQQRRAGQSAADSLANVQKTQIDQSNQQDTLYRNLLAQKYTSARAAANAAQMGPANAGFGGTLLTGLPYGGGKTSLGS